MSEKFVCRTCKKQVRPKGSVVECCGFKETVPSVIEENQRHRRSFAKEFSKKMQWSDIEEYGITNEDET